MAIIERNSDISSDEDQKELVDNLMERQCYSIIKRSYSGSSEKSISKGKEEKKKSIKKINLKSPAR